MTDYKALCAELAANLHRYQRWYIEDNGCSLHVHETEALLRRADAALAQPEPEAESTLREEFTRILNEARCNSPRVIGNIELGRRLVAAVERFNRAQPEPNGPAPQPIPVSERLPGPDDCDAEGLCWCWHAAAYTWGVFRLDLTAHSHWLPANALPQPS